MADLSARSVRSNKDFAVDDHSAAYACAQRDHDHILFSDSAALPHLAEGSDIRVIPDARLHACKLFQLFLDLFIIPPEIRASVHDSLGSYRCRHSGTDTDDILFCQAVFFHFVLYGSCHIRKDRFPFL